MRKSIALYDPYLDVLGGGERYVLSILKALEEDFEPTIFWEKDIQNTIKNKFAISFDRKIKFLPNIFRQSGNFIDKLRYLKNINLFMYVTDGSYITSFANKTFIYAMIPQRNLYRMDLVNRLKTINSQFITHSKFNQLNLQKWGISGKVLYPYINSTLFKINKAKKKNIILCVGRFFRQLHSKRQDKIIYLFKKLKQENNLYTQFELILAGGLKEEDMKYMNELKKLIGSDSAISLVPNPSFYQLRNLYEQATYFWHFSGYSVDETKSPELVEHLGITPLEAMAAGCIVFCYEAGGPKELVTDGINGYLFKNEAQLTQKMKKIMIDTKLQTTIAQSAQNYVQKKFNYEVFVQKVKKIFTT